MSSTGSWTTVTDHPEHGTFYRWTDNAGNGNADLRREADGWKLSIDSLWEKSVRDLGDMDDERALARASDIVDGLGFRDRVRDRGSYRPPPLDPGDLHPCDRDRDDPWDR